MTEKIIGIHAAKAMLEHNASEVISVLLSDQRSDNRLRQLESLARQSQLRTRRVSASKLFELSNGAKHQGVVLICNRLFNSRAKTLKQFLGTLADQSFIVILDSINDPRNLGACIRSAHAAGVGGIIITKNRGCAVTSTVSRIAAGAAQITPIFEVSNLARAIEFLKEKNYWVIGLEPKVDAWLYGVELQERCALVFGSEETGLRKHTKTKCDMLVQIPMFGGIQSLNVSVTVGIACFEVARQRIMNRHKK